MALIENKPIINLAFIDELMKGKLPIASAFTPLVDLQHESCSLELNEKRKTIFSNKHFLFLTKEYVILSF